MRLPRLVPFVILLLAVALPVAWLVAGVPQHAATEIAVGADPVDVAVTPDDRIVAALLGTSSVTLSWIDTADFSAGPFTVGLSGDEALSLEAAELDDGPAVFVGGSQLDVVRFDVSTVADASPATDAPTGLGGDGGSLVALEWDATSSGLFAADASNDSVRHVDFGAAEPTVDAMAGWPVPLPFTPADLVLSDATTLVVVGGGIAVIDLSNPTSPTLTLVDAIDAGDPVAVTSEGDGRALILFDTGVVASLTTEAAGDDDDSAGDDDDSAGDDDDSAGDDDDSAADDDDSATDDDDSATDSGRDEGDFILEAFGQGPTGATDLVQRTVDGVAWLHVLGGNEVQQLDDVGAFAASFALSADGTALAAASGDDGFIYATTGETGQVAVLSAGPWLQIDQAEPLAIATTEDEIAVTFSALFGDDDAGSCTWTLAVDADIDGGGTALEGTGTAAFDTPVELTLTGAELPSGDHRVWIF